MKTVSIIRNRGQLTIPDSIRKLVTWTAPLSAVIISVGKPDEIIIKPHQIQKDWTFLWNLIKKSRATKGKGKENAVTFLTQDRNSH